MAEQPLSPHVPRHIGIIMDGNGRWAQKRGLLRVAGHRAGTQNVRPLLESAVEFGVGYLTIWAFSTENWVRPQAEVDSLMSLVGESLDHWLPELHASGVRLRHLGKLDRLPPPLQGRILDAVTLTGSNNRITLSVAFDYGGRDEILRAVQKLMAEGIAPGAVTEDLISARLDTAGLPNPDLIIRTGGDFRVSNFMLWEAAYAEYYFTPVLWPDFDREELRRAIDEYGRRQRRFGGLPSGPDAAPEGKR